ncbi:MAG: cytochrome c3 family protein [Ferruginibacter sp.]
MNEPPEKSNDFRGEEYIGSSKCITCHKEIYDSYSKTAHNLSSLPASKEAIKGSFEKDSNVLYYRPTLKVVMEQRDSSFYQIAYIDDIERQGARFDMVVGSGRKGQSYLYWVNENIFQLPVSYYVPGKSWVNSPNYPPKNVQFNRNIPIGCFECHSSYIKRTATKPSGHYLVDYFDKTQVIYGIDCERCHGPAAAHVNFHEKNPQEKEPKYIGNIAGLARQEKLDMCAMCHSGARETIKSTFTFKPGSKLADFLHPDTSTLNTSRIDVHGRQYQLLTASKCFIKSTQLNCFSCHNTHVEERNNMSAFSAKCMDCHKIPNHDSVEMPTTLRGNIANNCIDCHMPARPSALITMTTQTQSAPIPALVRTHYISIYPDETKKYILKQK